MPRFKADFQLPSFDGKAYRRELHAKMSDVIQDAVRVWLNATVVSLVPVWSGASAATFLHLARAATVHLNTTPSPTAWRDRRALGVARSGPSNPVTYGDQGRYEFEYATTLRHLVFNEFNDANVVFDPAVFSQLVDPGPYRFQARGQEAFRGFARGVRLPNPMPFIKRKSLKVS